MTPGTTVPEFQCWLRVPLRREESITCHMRHRRHFARWRTRFSREWQHSGVLLQPATTASLGCGRKRLVITSADAATIYQAEQCAVAVARACQCCDGSMLQTREVCDCDKACDSTCQAFSNRTLERQAVHRLPYSERLLRRTFPVTVVETCAVTWYQCKSTWQYLDCYSDHLCRT